VPGTTPNIGLTYPLLSEAADIEAAVKPLALQLDAMRVGRRALVYSAQPVRDIGEVGQIRAGRQLAASDFTAMGLSAPLGLWNLGSLADASGNARNLTNKGTVPFTTGINGAATTAAQFAGSTAQALYIADTGAGDPFRIRTGSWGCWFRTAKRGTAQRLLSKMNSAGGQWCWEMNVSANNQLAGNISVDGTNLIGGLALEDVCDDRWHFGVATSDGSKIRVYLDGIAAGQPAAVGVGPMFAGSGPLNIGSYGADGATAAGSPHYGRVDEAFVTSDVLSPEQVLNLYCASITHGLTDIAAAPLAPKQVTLGARRRRRGGPLATTDFPTTPVRLHNFTAGALTDQGSGGVALAPVGGGSIVAVSGADGALNGAQSFSGAHTGLGATDAGLPSGTASRSYGGWVKATTQGANNVVIGWGTLATADVRLIVLTTGLVQANNAADGIAGPYVADGLWHQATVVEDNAAADGVKRKLYLDGRLVGGSTVLNTLTLAGANRFRVGAAPDGTTPFTGQIDGAFVYAGALTGEQVRALYNVGSLALSASPKAEGDHVEASETSRLLAQFATLEGVDTLDLEVMG
jgi:Concanavalin A-like lectin/glucanases superfamily